MESTNHKETVENQIRDIITLMSQNNDLKEEIWSLKVKIKALAAILRMYYEGKPAPMYLKDLLAEISDKINLKD